VDISIQNLVKTDQELCYEIWSDHIIDQKTIPTLYNVLDITYAPYLDHIKPIPARYEERAFFGVEITLLWPIQSNIRYLLAMDVCLHLQEIAKHLIIKKSLMALSGCKYTARYVIHQAYSLQLYNGQPAPVYRYAVRFYRTWLDV
jgi:hypothetical protein